MDHHPRHHRLRTTMDMIRAYREGDLEAVVGCFGRSVRGIGARYYTPAQIAGWAPDPPDRCAWADRLGTAGVFVAEIGGVLAGFVRIEAGGFVDLLYVDPEYERRGVARKLLGAASSWAARRGARGLESEASLAARPFFEAMGFRVENEQCVERGGGSFQIFRMAREAPEGIAPSRSRQGDNLPP